VYLTNIFKRQGDLITSEEGKKIQAQAWGEITDICKKESS